MRLFEKHWRATMPQIRSADLKDAYALFRAEGIAAEFAEVRVGDLRGIQNDVNKEKVANIAQRVEENGVEELPPMMVSRDGAILDGHHRQLGVIEACGPDQTVTVFRIDLPEEEALAVLKKTAEKVSESFSLFMELACLAEISGSMYESVLRSRGFSRAAIRRAVAIGLLKESGGVLTTVSRHLREAKVMAEFAPAVAAAARVVGGALAKKSAKMVAGQSVKKIDDGEEKKLQVVRDDNDGIMVIDPDNPGAGPQKVDREAVAPDEEEEEETE